MNAHVEQAVTPSCPVPVRRGRENGFSIIEVMVAMLVLIVVISAGVVSIAGSGQVTSGAAVMQHKTSVAQRALERAEGDLSEQSRCNEKIWKKDTPPRFSPCTVIYPDMRDSQGRKYTATIVVTPVDDPADGIGRADTSAGSTGGDSDFQSRDYYRATVTVELDPAAAVSIAAPHRKPYELASRLNWSVNEDASLSVNVCSHYRMDRSVDVATCSSSGARPVGGVVVEFTPVGTSANTAEKKTVTANSNGKVNITNGLPPGDYRVTARDVAGHQFYRASPEFLKAEAGVRHDVAVLMSLAPGQTRICYQITTPDNHDFGYWVNATNISWQEDKSPVYRNGRLTNIGETRRCQSTPLPDPLGYHKFLFQATYALSIQQVPRGDIARHPTRQGLRVQRVLTGSNCGSAKQTLSRGGGGNPARTDDAWMTTFDQRPGKHDICIEFEAYPIQSVPCSGPGPGCIEITTCVPTYTGKAVTPPGWDPCWPKWGEEPPTGPFDPCPGGVSGPLQKPGPDPIGSYSGPTLGFVGSGMTTYYGPGYACNHTASGERFDLNKLTASVLTMKGYVGYGWGTCARVWGDRGEAIIKFNDTGGNPHAFLDLSPGATIGLGYKPGDNPSMRAEVVQKNVPNGQGCAAWNLAGGKVGDCKVIQRSATKDCSKPYPPKITKVWVKPEAPAGRANPKGLSTMGNAGASRRSL